MSGCHGSRWFWDASDRVIKETTVHGTVLDVPKCPLAPLLKKIILNSKSMIVKKILSISKNDLLPEN